MSEFKGPEIIKNRGGLGRKSPSQDAIAGLISTVYTLPSGVSINSIYKLNQLSDAETLGFTASYDSNNGVFIYEHVKKFFHYAPNGTLYLMPVSEEATYSSVCATSGRLEQLLTSEDTNREIKVVGLHIIPLSITYTTLIEANLITAIPLAQAVAVALRDRAIYVDNIILGGMLDPALTSLSTLYNLRGAASEYVSVVVAADPEIDDSTPQVGSALGMLCARKVSECLGSVDIVNKPEAFKGLESYPLTNVPKNYFLSASLTSGTRYSALSETDKGILRDKGYIYAGKYEGLDGYFFNDSHTAVVVTDDYAYIEDNRVWNKAVRLLRQALLPVMKGEVEIDPATGFLPASQIAFYEAKAVRKVSEMTQNNEISGNPVVTIEPSQDVVGTGKISMSLQYVRRGILRQLEAEVGAINPAA